jgi:hypothetical protein
LKVFVRDNSEVAMLSKTSKSGSIFPLDAAAITQIHE